MSQSDTSMTRGIIFLSPLTSVFFGRPHDLSQGSITQGDSNSSGISSATAASAVYRGDILSDSEDGSALGDGAR